jgi:hypothetical protein
MATHPVYERILQDLHDGGELTVLEEKIVDALQKANGENVTRRALIYAVFGLRIPEHISLNNNSEDRKIRAAIQSLRSKGATMIVASSGAAGYCIDASEERAEEMAGEMEKRARELSALAEKIRAALRPVEVTPEIAARIRARNDATEQIPLFGG